MGGGRFQMTIRGGSQVDGVKNRFGDKRRVIGTWKIVYGWKCSMEQVIGEGGTNCPRTLNRLLRDHQPVQPRRVRRKAGTPGFVQTLRDKSQEPRRGQIKPGAGMAVPAADTDRLRGRYPDS